MTFGRVDPPHRAVAHVLTKGAGRVTGINATTRIDLQAIIAKGMVDGLSPRELGDQIEAYHGWDEYRAERIATTELQFAYNTAATSTYKDMGVNQVQAIDGDEDEECAARDGQIFDVDEAASIEDHPNGTLDWVPVVSTMDDNAFPNYAGGDTTIPGHEPRELIKMSHAGPFEELPTAPAMPGPSPLNLDEFPKTMHLKTQGDYLDSGHGERWIEDRDVVQSNAEYRDMTPEQFDEALLQGMNDALDEVHPYMAIDPGPLQKVLNGGRFKSQFETRSSGGMLDEGYRANQEADMFGYAQNLPASERPVYGYLGRDPGTGVDLFGDATHDAIGQYGSITVRFNDELAARTTFTAADSLSGAHLPSPLLNPRMESAFIPRYSRGRGIYESAERWAGDSGYIEAQYHGGLSTDLIDRIYVTYSTGHGPTVHLEDAIARAGFKLYSNACKTINYSEKCVAEYRRVVK